MSVQSCTCMGRTLKMPKAKTVVTAVLVATLAIMFLVGILGYTGSISMNAITATALTGIPLLGSFCFLRYSCC